MTVELILQTVSSRVDYLFVGTSSSRRTQRVAIVMARISKILITGGSGLLAANWAIHKRRECDVLLVLHSRIIRLNGVRSISLALDRPNDLQRVFREFRPDYVVHAAGMTSVEACEKNPDLAHQVNADLAGAVAGACASVGAKLVYISTDHLFAGDAPNVAEGVSPAPVNVYGRSKALAEVMVKAQNDEALILRTNFFGWGPPYRASFSDSIIWHLRHGIEVKLFHDVYFTPILIEVLIDATEDLVRRKERGVFNVVGDERLSKYEFGLKFAEAMGARRSLVRPISILNRPGLVRRPMDMSLSNQKVTRTLQRSLGCCDDFIVKLFQQDSPEFSGEIHSL
ncbi:MAG: SDR family oxidoreductase [Gammaproteobacteria bacterium]|nr:SDR family oxidoreductase [Gammaproteobacteria bacterium]